MALFYEAEVKARAQTELREAFHANAEELIVKSARAYTPSKTYDIFLSHSVRDAQLILGMKKILEDLNYTVYVDWIHDPQLNRSNVTTATANKLRQRMKSSKSLFYITTSNATQSKWMPWECGYFDGDREKVAIVPIERERTVSNSYSGQEYLGLYPYCLKEKNDNNQEKLWIHKDNKTYASYDYWVKMPDSQVKWKNV